MPIHPWFGLIETSLEATRRTLEIMGGFGGLDVRTVPVAAPTPPAAQPWRWTTPNRVTAELTTMRVREFRRMGRPARDRADQAVIMVAPYALHAATTADFAKGHSVIEALLNGGVPRLVLTDWRSAGPRMAELSFDHYLAELNALIDDVGAPAAIVGLCQGGLLAAIYAARFPKKVSRLALAGAPLDTDAERSVLTNMIRSTPQAAIDRLIAQGDGLLRADLVMSLWPTTASAEADIRKALQVARPTPPLVRRFAAWNADLVDLPGVFYRQTVDLIFRRNAFARREFVALGRTVGLGDVRCPLFLLAAAQDDIVSPAQVLTARQSVSSPPRDIASRLVEGRHLSLYMGRSVLATAWPDIAAFLGEPSRLDLSRQAGNGSRRDRTLKTPVVAGGRTFA
jgi:poly(3-hydroxyalkanoate) synthetase